MPVKWVKTKYDDIFVGVEIPPYNVVYIIPMWKHRAEIDEYCRGKCGKISTDIIRIDKMPFLTCFVKDCPFKREDKFYKKIGKYEYYLRRLKSTGKQKTFKEPVQTKLSDFLFFEEIIRNVKKSSEMSQKIARGDKHDPRK